jgi:uncharacterized membrane protein
MAADVVLRAFASYTGLLVQGFAVVLIAYGAFETFVRVVGEVTGRMTRPDNWRQHLFVGFGRWLILGLEFALAADIVNSVISPTWNDIGQLAAIAVIRTFLNYFLERDIIEARRIGRTAPS